VAQRRRLAADQPAQDPRQAVARDVKDSLLKRLASTVPGDFLATLGLTLPPVAEVLAGELHPLAVRTEQPDLLLRLADASLVHLEFQTTSRAGDLARFYHYHVAISDQYACRVYTVVVYGPGIVSAPMELDRGSAIFRVQNVYLGQRQAEVLVERLQARAAKGERWTAREQVEAILLPLMGRRHSLLALLAEVVEASAVLAKEERSNVLGSMVGLAYNYLEPGKAEQLLEALRKVNAFEELIVDQVLEGRAKGHAEGHAEGRAEGQAEGRAEGEQDAILRVLGRRLGTVPMELAAQIRAQQDVQQLEVLLDAALDAEDMATFARLVRQGVPRA